MSDSGSKAPVHECGPACHAGWWPFSRQVCAHTAAAPPPPPPPPPPLIDFAFYPHIVEAVALNAPYEIQLAFRRVSSSFKRLVDIRLATCVELALPDDWSGDLAEILRSRGRCIPLLGPPPPGAKRSERMDAALSDTRVLEIPDMAFVDGSGLIRSWAQALLAPHTVRIGATSDAPHPFAPEVLETAVDVERVPRFEVPASVRWHVLRLSVSSPALFGERNFDPTKGFAYADADKLKTLVIVLESMPEQRWHCTATTREPGWKDVLGALFRLPFSTEMELCLVEFPKDHHAAVREAVSMAMEYTPALEESGEAGRRSVFEVKFIERWYYDLLPES